MDLIRSFLVIEGEEEVSWVVLVMDETRLGWIVWIIFWSVSSCVLLMKRGWVCE